MCVFFFLLLVCCYPSRVFLATVSKYGERESDFIFNWANFKIIWMIGTCERWNVKRMGGNFIWGSIHARRSDITTPLVITIQHFHGCSSCCHYVTLLEYYHNNNKWSYYVTAPSLKRRRAYRHYRPTMLRSLPPRFFNTRLSLASRARTWKKSFLRLKGHCRLGFYCLGYTHLLPSNSHTNNMRS